MYHIRITAPVATATRRIVKANNGVIEHVRGDRSGRIVTLPGYYQPQAAAEVERDIYAAQAAAR